MEDGWTWIIVLLMLGGYILIETLGSLGALAIVEGFSNYREPLREDSERIKGGRDMRFAAANVNLDGIGSVAVDFCRAVTNPFHTARVTDDGSLCVICERADGGAPLQSHSVRDGFRMSRDDYWTERGDYCRILKDDATGEWSSQCLVPGKHAFKDTEMIDADPPPRIKDLLHAYDGILMWFRFVDDRLDYAGNAICSSGSKGVEFSEVLAPLKTRGVQLNRDLAVETRGFLRVGERSGTSRQAGEASSPTHSTPTHSTDQSNLLAPLGPTISPRQIRAISCWVWWDVIESGATLFEAHNSSEVVHRKDRIALGVEGEGYFFEIWDEEQRIMRINAPMGSVNVGVWQHVTVTTTDSTAWWPTWQFFIDGALVATKSDGRLSPAMELVEASIGRGVRGCIVDFRLSRVPLDPPATMDWARPRLYASP